MIRINNDWEYTPSFSDSFAGFEGAAEPVRLPHNVHELPLHYADPADYSFINGYRRTLFLPPEEEGRRQFLQFDGAAHIAEVFVNGEPVAVHRCGYTGFRAEFTALSRYGQENRIVVRLDSRENPEIPPFGGTIDYLTYGGLYRDVWYDSRPAHYISDVFISTPEVNKAHIEVSVSGSAAHIQIGIYDSLGTCVYQLMGNCENPELPACFDLTLAGAAPWTPELPNLYSCQVRLIDENDCIGDLQTVTFGFRKTEFRTDGFYLNGVKYFLRGLNRHQSYPFIGYAAPAHLQEEDARILKEELAVNAVRTSHYPQSPYFLDACDRLGLFVFTELPGWQHIGDESWKEQALENLREMILQNRNHPSVILWGVRINESQDDDDFYSRANQLAHALDPYRPTSGVRYLMNSSLLEDVYAFHDFSYAGDKKPVSPKKAVMKKADREKPLLISEHSGHTLPTKAFDHSALRQAQALRHAAILGGAMKDGDHAGCFGWCMFDYATHCQFGSGDRICYHGVCDSFRNPKPAASLYASQSDGRAVLEVVSNMGVGDYAGANPGDIFAFTNAEEVRLYRDEDFVKSFFPKERFGLIHEPILIDDLVGDLLEKREHFRKGKANSIRKCLLAVNRSIGRPYSLGLKLQMLKNILLYRITVAEATRLYNDYFGGWGSGSHLWRFEAIRDGKPVADCLRGSGRDLHLEVSASRLVLTEGETYDIAAVRIRLVDELGQPAVYAALPIGITVSGPLSIVGPSVISAEGGSTGTYLKTVGQTGTATVRFTCAQTQPVEISFRVEG